MRLPVILACIIMVMLSSCSAPHKDNVQPLSQDLLFPRAGMARFILYYPYSHIWQDKAVNIKIAGSQDCSLTSGNYFLRDVSPGKVEIAASLCNGNGVTRLTVMARPDMRYYVQIMPKDKSLLGLMAEYGIHNNEDKATHAEGTAFYIDLMDEQTANTQLSQLKMIK